MTTKGVYKRRYSWQRQREQCSFCGCIGHRIITCPEAAKRKAEEHRQKIAELMRPPTYHGLLEAPEPPKPRERAIFGRRDEIAHLRGNPCDDC